MVQVAKWAPPSLEEMLAQINADLVKAIPAKKANVFYPVNRGFRFNDTLFELTHHNVLSSLVVILPEVSTNYEAEIQVKKISMPHHGETIEDYLTRIDSILKDLDDHGKFVKL